jgi:eukaryotic-like serine/threonine-protein kinase
MQTILTAQDWGQLQAIFDVAVELSPSDRAAYLDEVCGGDAALRPRVESLLRAVDEDTGIYEAVGRIAADCLQGSLPAIGERIGHYRITGVIGRGGMGVVYRAVRADDEYNKEVAIKVAAFGLLTPGMRERFLRERQILANLDHPNIARLLDGGTTPDGAPFVVMEFVAGQPIDGYCASSGLTRLARIGLMIEVARAVDYAHRHLLVHRDLKPDNILVTSEGEPKLLDFGIAKALDPEAVAVDGAKTLDAARLMTPDYASPEQVLGGTITTATDVYQLGMLLYLLLVGKRPFNAASAGMAELERAICVTPPPKPDLDADLDRILLQTLEKEPVRRYVSASALADDLQRYIDGFPVQARKASWTYFTGKFVRRHKLSVSAVGALALLLVGVSIAMTVLARRAHQQALIASQQAGIANQTTDFLLRLFQASDPNVGRGDKITARELLDKGAQELKRSGEQDPVVRVRLLDSMGAIYNSLGLSQQAKEMLEESLRLRETKLPRDDVALADTLSKLGVCEQSLSNFEAARKLHERALNIYRSKLPKNDNRLALERYYLGQISRQQNRLPEAELALREAAAMNIQNQGSPGKTSTMLRELSAVLRNEGKYEESYQTAKNANVYEFATLRPNDPGMCASWATLSSAAFGVGRLEEAEQDERSGIAACLESYEPGSPEVQEARYLLGGYLGNLGEFDEAEVQLRQALAGFTKLYGTTSVMTAEAEDALGLVLRKEGRNEEAYEEGEAALQARLKIVPDSLPMVMGLRHLAQTDYAAGDLKQASEHIDRAIRILDRKFSGVHNSHLVPTEVTLSEVQAAQGDLPAAEQAAHSAFDAARGTPPEGLINTSSAESTLGWIYYLEGRFGEGCPLLRHALTTHEATYGPRSAMTARLGIRLAICDTKAGRREEADAMVRKYRTTLQASHDGTYRVEQGWLRAHPLPSRSTPSLVVSESVAVQAPPPQ